MRTDGQLARIILFVKDVERVAAFYENALGLKPKIDPRYPASEWMEMESGGVCVALHRAMAAARTNHGGHCPNKIVFYAKDVAKTRARLVRKKVKMGKLKQWGELVLCDGRDPAGNVFQISNR